MTDLQTLLQIAADWAASRDRTWRAADGVGPLVEAADAQRRFPAELMNLLLHLNLAQAGCRSAVADAQAARLQANTALDRAVEYMQRAAAAERRLAAVERQLQASREAGRIAMARARLAEARLQALQPGRAA